MKTDHYRTVKAGTGRKRPVCCPGCSGRLEFHQPDENEPDELIGVCTNPDCLDWSLWSAHDRAMVMTSRIPKAARDHRNPAWKPARPTSPSTAGR
jgi:hypothetical protein